MSEAESVYQYCDEKGALLYEVVRFPGKRFRIRHAEGDGNWIWGFGGVRRVLYRLNEVVLADEIFLVEGEKDVETLRSLGIVATTNPNGASSWRSEYGQYLRDKNVVVIPDKDAAGRGWAALVLKDLSGVAVSVKLFDPPGLEPESGADITDWFTAGHTKKELLALLGATQASERRSRLRETIDGIRSDSQLLGFQKKRAIARALLEDFSARGTFYITPNRQTYFFELREHKLYRIESDEFVRFVSEVSQLNPTEIEFKFTIEEVRTYVDRNGVQANVFQLGHLDRAADKLYITDFGGGVFVITPDGVESKENGVDGVLFESFNTAQAVCYVAPPDRTGSLTEFIDQINFDSRGPITAAAYRMLLRIWSYSLFFPELHRTRVIPLFFGSQGSGKTTCARRLGILLFGPRFNVTHLESGERGEQAFIAAVCGSPFVAFDNADDRIRWLSDHLARHATGSNITLRELHTTNRQVTFESTSSIVLTSRDPQFRRPDVAERLLIFPLVRLQSFLAEAALFDQIVAIRDSLFSELIDELQRILPMVLEAKQGFTSFRMADFANFGLAITKGDGSEQEFKRCLRAIEATQANYAVEDDPVIELLADWLAERNSEEVEIETGALYTELLNLAERKHLLIPKSVSAFGKRLREVEPVLRASLGIVVSKLRVGHTTRWKFTFNVKDQSPDSESSDSPDSSSIPSEPVSEVAQVSEVREVPEKPAFSQTLDGRYRCLICECVFATEPGWRAHIRQNRCAGGT